LHPPGIAEESGHLGSEAPYLGEGLDQAFKMSLKNIGQSKIQTIFSSMNGESHWAKEYGIAYMRNSSSFDDELTVQHPAENFGDVGVATSTVLIALTAEHLHNNPNLFFNQVYCSSDCAKRAAIVVEKLSVTERS
jgi:3-oxoacyl-[acyl-carrier-protein] synthase I